MFSHFTKCIASTSQLQFSRSRKFRDFVTVCLIKDYLQRPTAEQLLQVIMKRFSSFAYLVAMNCDVGFFCVLRRRCHAFSSPWANIHVALLIDKALSSIAWLLSTFPFLMLILFLLFRKDNGGKGSACHWWHFDLYGPNSSFVWESKPPREWLTATHHACFWEKLLKRERKAGITFTILHSAITLES